MRKTISRGKKRARAVVESEKVRTAWQVGKLIFGHIQANLSNSDSGKIRAAFGKRVVENLARDLDSNRTHFYYALEFYLSYPIVPTLGQLGWSHYRYLLSVNNSKQREALTKRAFKKKWSVAQLRGEIRNLKERGVHSAGRLASAGGLMTPWGSQRGVGGSPVSVKLKPLLPGKLNVLRTREVNGRKMLDLGFSTYLERGHVFKRVPSKLKLVKDRRFTYKVELERVVDGDTLWVLVDLGLGVKTRQKLRLRAIDASELKHPGGPAAKRYLTKLLPAEFVITTTRSDKYDRYLADLFVGETYINGLLIEKGYAVGIDEGESKLNGY